MASALTFPTRYNVAGLALALGTEVSQLVSEFLTKGISPCTVVELVSP